MDGVPGLSYAGVKPGETFIYRFPIKQAGTYWYHSHSGFQEQSGHYGPIIIEPIGGDPIAYDREYVIVLADWTFENPMNLFAKLKKYPEAYNYQKRMLIDFFRDSTSQGFDAAYRERSMWGQMRMDPTYIADVTGATYSCLINGHGAKDNWTGLFKPGERIRLRIINASAMAFFNLRIPGLPMTVVQSDGLNVQPVETDELQIGVAETYDVIVTPQDDKAYTFMAESIDRSEYVRATLAPRLGMVAPVPHLRKRPTLTMRDMAMAGHGDHEMSMPKPATANGDGVDGIAEIPSYRLDEPGIGLENQPHRVLTYADLKSLTMNPDMRMPDREMELHLTGNMHRYMWSFDGVKFSEVDGSIIFNQGERIRLTLVNDTMMSHPIHLHGMFFDVVKGPDHDHFKPRKHTITVKPGEKLSVDITADAVGDWAFHCHLLYHMAAGMMQVVSVRPRDAPIPPDPHQGHSNHS